MSKRNQLKALRGGLLTQFKIDDPNIKKLFEQLNIKTNKSDEQKEIIRRLRIQNKKQIEQVGLLKERLRTLKEEKIKMLNSYTHIKKLNSSLSEALGSCHECWGENSSCHVCKGKGISGWRKVNRRFFNVYVLSGIEKLNMDEERNNGILPRKINI